MKYSWSLAAFALLSSGVDAFWRMQCGSPLLTDMVDPLVQPGTVPAKHIHNIMGGSAFDSTISFAKLQSSSCTSCEVKGDKSSYWVPTLYFKKSNGEIVQVPQKDGMLVYYIPERGGNTVEMFPEGFGMMAGDPTFRAMNSSNAVGSEMYNRQMAIGFNCLDYAGTPEGFGQLKTLPKFADMKACANGLRGDITFPSCWNGENDSADHRSHMAYPSAIEDGVCPDTHKRRLITMKFETLWDVAQFFTEPDGEFVLSTGDVTGYGYHGDFYNGWDSSLLLAAYKDPTCVPPVTTATGGVITDCNTFVSQNQIQSMDDMDKCKRSQISDQTYAGPFTKLPGCNPIGAETEECPASSNSISGAKPVLANAADKPVASPSTTSVAPPLPPAPKPTTISTTTRAKPKYKPTTTSKAAPAPISSAPANPVLNVENKPKKIKEVIVTVVETVYETIYSNAVETATAYVPHQARHRRFRRRSA
ncbi:hypothetical protein AA313_de0202652 [Arthrobotrys entomopaga]|nr:hypothetical protein AA313_de0202652 [Arthrobotrys entomopaga]